MKTLVTKYFFLTTLLAPQLIEVTALSVYEITPKRKDIFTFGESVTAYEIYLGFKSNKKGKIARAAKYQKDGNEESIPDLRDPMINENGLVDTISRFDRERIPERVVHARGAGAYGIFTATKNLTNYTKAAFLNVVGKRTPVFVRFGTGSGDRGSADTRPDVRSFSIKFYTEEGNLDFVGLNFPIFFTDKPSLYPSLVHAMKANPMTNLNDPDMLWDVAIKEPSLFNMFILYFSDYSTPDGYRHIDGYPIHTYELENENGDVYYAKFHFKTDQGLKNFPLKGAFSLAGSDPGYSTRDLYRAISTNLLPSWTVYMQLMDLDELETADFNPFSLIRTWPEDAYPLREVGRIVLDRNPTNYFEEVEQAAFCPGNLVPGILGSPDPIFQARKFSYPDSQYHRLGANFHQIHVNKPLPDARIDGVSETDTRRTKDNKRHRASMRRYFKRLNKKPTRYDDEYVEARKLYVRFLDVNERLFLAMNIARSLQKTTTDLQLKALAIFDTINEELSYNIRQNMYK